MKKLFIVALALCVASSLYAVTYNENFDVADNWSGDYGGYAGTAEYSNPDGIGSFEATTALRDTQEDYSPPYAFRLDDIAGDYFRYKIEAGVTSFSVYTADWDVSDNNTFQIRYSTDSGVSYTVLLDENASYYSADKVYKQFTSGTLNISPDAGKEIFIEVYNEGGIERIMIDDFSVVSVPEPAFLGLLPLLLFFLRRK